MSLYGLKYSGTAFRAFLSDMLDNIGFRSIIAYPRVWMRADTNPTGETYYYYIICYVDDILCISHNDIQTMGEIHKNVNFSRGQTVSTTCVS